MNKIDNEINNAHEKISTYTVRTPLIKSNFLSERLDANVWLKLESKQPTNSFKVRGAFNKLLSLDDKAKQRGVITASTGNHGAAVAYAGKELNIPVTVFVPHNAVQKKLNNIAKFDAKIIIKGDACDESELFAKKLAQEKKITYVSPYNDMDIIHGQGTIAIELFEELNSIDSIYVPVGGGGLISGIAAYSKMTNPNIKIFGCLPKNSPVLYESIKAGKIVTIKVSPTLSDATAGNIDMDSVTFPLCQRYVDDYLLATEEEIRSALKTMYEQENLVIEGAAGCCIGALLNKKLSGETIIIIVSGSNVDLETI